MKSNSTYIITIDGTSGSGKTTISKSLAKKLGFNLLDSGKLYRSAGFVYLQSKESFSDSNTIKDIIKKIATRKAIKKASKIIGKKGRILVRKSGTEPKIRIMAESHDKSLILKCIRIIKQSIKY